MFNSNKHNIFFYVVLGFIFLYCLKIYGESDVFNLKCVISDKDGQRYCVRERSKIKEATNLLAEVTDTCKKIVLWVPSQSQAKIIQVLQRFCDADARATIFVPKPAATVEEIFLGATSQFC